MFDKFYAPKGVQYTVITSSNVIAGPAPEGMVFFKEEIDKEDNKTITFKRNYSFYIYDRKSIINLTK